MSASLGYSKYTDNRNRWRKVIGYEKYSPSPLTFVDKNTQTNYTLDLNKTNRDRNFFLVEDRDSYILPNQIPDCCLWLRSDLGVSAASNGNIVRWTDQVSGTVFYPSGSFATPFVTTVSGVQSITFPASSSVSSSVGISLYSTTQINMFLVLMPTKPFADTNTYGTVINAVNFDLGISGAFQFLMRTDGFPAWTPIYRSAAGVNGVTAESQNLNDLYNPISGRINKFFWKLNTITSPIQTGSLMFNDSVSTTINGSKTITSESFSFSTANGSSSIFYDHTLQIGSNAYAPLLRPYSGSIMEIIIYNRNLTSEEYTLVNSYLSFRYNLPI
jgi:hypothetical protein